MDLGEALWAELADRDPSAQVASWGDALDFYMRRSDGNAAAAARSAGVPASTWRRWLGGAMPAFDRLASILAAARATQARSRLSHRREQQYREASDLVLFGRWRYEANKPRRVGLGGYLAEGWADAVVDAYLAGGTPRQLWRELHSHVIDSQFYEATLSPESDDEYGWNLTGVEWE